MNSSDIAKLAGVSRSTVSRILNGYDDISYETRKKVEAIIKEYNYIPNSYGRGLAGKANRIIGLFIVDVDNWSEDNLVLSRSEVFSDFTAYASDIAHNLNYNILISIIDQKNYDDLPRLFLDKSICAGLIIGDTYDQETINDKYKVIDKCPFCAQTNVNIELDEKTLRLKHICGNKQQSFKEKGSRFSNIAPSRMRGNGFLCS